MTGHQPEGEVFAGVDTHTDTHHAAVVDPLGRPLADREFPATTEGYRALLAWLDTFGIVRVVGVECTGSYGAGLTRVLTTAGLVVVEVNVLDRGTRHARGKSDPIDAYAAARAAASGRAHAIPKARTGMVEALRQLRVVRASAVKARTQAMNQLIGLRVTAPEPLRQALTGLARTALITTCLRLRPGADLTDPAHASRFALRQLARRIRRLTEEIDELEEHLTALTTAAAPDLAALFGVGTETAGQLLVTAGDNPERLRSEAAFAALCGAAPVPASSGRTDRHRLSRGGDRQANRALHMIAVVRMRYCPRTRAYVARRTQQGLTKKDIIRCLKRFIAREVYHALTRPHRDRLASVA
ncbi:IS110 family transposase [Streptomyces hirsutus]|uniref:IS110 family transposase n=1 Tax=Streptomyces hirsutus TaxID=35620 RepID=UPI0006E2AAA7|nr:IS110 family transposase [Streptomyces hirsutus]